MPATRQTETAAASLKPDLIAGLTAAAVVLPKAMAYATVAGLPVAAGLYTAFVPMVVYALLGTSLVLSVSSTATLAILAPARSWRWLFLTAIPTSWRLRQPPSPRSPVYCSCSLRPCGLGSSPISSRRPF